MKTFIYIINKVEKLIEFKRIKYQCTGEKARCVMMFSFIFGSNVLQLVLANANDSRDSREKEKEREMNVR